MATTSSSPTRALKAMLALLPAAVLASLVPGYIIAGSHGIPAGVFGGYVLFAALFGLGGAGFLILDLVQAKGRARVWPAVALATLVFTGFAVVLLASALAGTAMQGAGK